MGAGVDLRHGARPPAAPRDATSAGPGTAVGGPFGSQSQRQPKPPAAASPYPIAAPTTTPTRSAVSGSVNAALASDSNQCTAAIVRHFNSQPRRLSRARATRLAFRGVRGYLSRMASAARDRPLARQLEELAAVHESLRALTSTLEFPEILRAVLDRIKVFTAAEGLSLLLYDAEHDELVFAATETLADNALVGRAEPGADRAARQAANTGGAVFADGGRILAVPLRRAGKAVGAVEVRARHELGPFIPADAE